jgi:hypothetical protein
MSSSSPHAFLGKKVAKPGFNSSGNNVKARCVAETRA